MSIQTETERRRHEAARAALGILHHWNQPFDNPPRVAGPVPDELAAEADLLRGIDGLDLLRLLYNERVRFSPLI